jgi:hypothetical protein
MRHPRFTVRRLMVAVAVVGVIGGGWIEGERRRARFRELVKVYTLQVMNYSAIMYSGPGGEHFEKYVRDRRAKNAKPLAYYTEMLRKYQFAARYPWLPVAPDPPEPE